MKVSLAHCSRIWHPLQEKDNGWPKVLDIYFENNDTVAFSWEEAITIEETGMYYLWFVICDDELSAATVRGQTTWKNPTGDAQGGMPASFRKLLCVQGTLSFGSHAGIRSVQVLSQQASWGWLLSILPHWPQASLTQLQGPCSDLIGLLLQGTCRA